MTMTVESTDTETVLTIEVDVDLNKPIVCQATQNKVPICDAPATHRAMVVHDGDGCTCRTYLFCPVHVVEMYQQAREFSKIGSLVCLDHELSSHPVTVRL